MKKLLMGFAALSMVVPSVASAGTAAQALSVKAAAIEPVRAAAEPGETKAVRGVVPILIGLVVFAGLIWIIADSDSN